MEHQATTTILPAGWNTAFQEAAGTLFGREQDLVVVGFAPESLQLGNQPTRWRVLSHREAIRFVMTQQLLPELAGVEA